MDEEAPEQIQVLNIKVAPEVSPLAEEVAIGV